MAKLTPQQVLEVNAVIAEIDKVVKADSEIGACEKSTLSGLLSSHGLSSEATFFKCRRELSSEIVSYFVKEKSITKSRFDRHAQTHIFVMNKQEGTATSEPKTAPVKPAASKAATQPEAAAKKAPAKKEAVKKSTEASAVKKETKPAGNKPAKTAAKKSAPAKKKR